VCSSCRRSCRSTKRHGLKRDRQWTEDRQGDEEAKEHGAKPKMRATEELPLAVSAVELRLASAARWGEIDLEERSPARKLEGAASDLSRIAPRGRRLSFLPNRFAPSRGHSLAAVRPPLTASGQLFVARILGLRAHALRLLVALAVLGSTADRASATVFSWTGTTDATGAPRPTGIPTPPNSSCTDDMVLNASSSTLRSAQLPPTAPSTAFSTASTDQLHDQFRHGQHADAHVGYITLTGSGQPHDRRQRHRHRFGPRQRRRLFHDRCRHLTIGGC